MSFQIYNWTITQNSNLHNINKQKKKWNMTWENKEKASLKI